MYECNESIYYFRYLHQQSQSAVTHVKKSKRKASKASSQMPAVTRRTWDGD